MTLFWSLTIEVGNYVITEEGADTMDEFSKLVGDGKSGVTMTAGNSVDFGRIKVSASVHTTCNQDEQTIDRAGSITFHKALELMVYGMSELRDLRRDKPELFKAVEP